MGMPCVSESMQTSVVVLETVVKGRSLIITDAPVMVEAEAYQFPWEALPKAPDEATIVSGFNGDGPADTGVMSVFGLVWWDSKVPSQTERLPQTNL